MNDRSGREITFANEHEEYTLKINLNNNTMLSSADQYNKKWTIYKIEKNDNSLVLSGIAPIEVSGVNGVWFELKYGKESIIEYWEKKVLLKVDSSVNDV